MLADLSPIGILALTIFGEGRGDTVESQIAVGCVIRNRLHSGKYKSYNEVCLAPKQFSCWNEDDPNYPLLIDLAQKWTASNEAINDPYLKQCIFIAEGIASWIIMDNTNGATNYMTRGLFQGDRPKWAMNPKNQILRGNQVFFSV